MSAPARAVPTWWRRFLNPFLNRPHLLAGLAAGLLVFVALALGAPALPWTSKAVLAWNLAALLFIVLVLRKMRGQDEASIRARAAEQDEGKGLILVVVLVAAVASLAATGLELSLAKNAHGLTRTLQVVLAVTTVTLSWATVQFVFALHYAHEYYAPDETTPDEGDLTGGLGFPGGAAPDYWDFLHFALVIGVASQTADIAFTSKSLRRIGTVHSLVAFVFNTVILALTINLAAGLF